MNTRHNVPIRLPKKIVEVYLPRLSLQIMHEWTTPANKKIVEIKDDNDKRDNYLISNN